MQDVLCAFLHAVIGYPADQRGYQRFRHTRVDSVHRHVVAVVGGPAQSQLRHVPGADYQPFYPIRVVHQYLHSLPGLAVFVRHVVDIAIMFNILEVLRYGIVDRYLLDGNSNLSHQCHSVVVGTLSRAKPRHGKAVDIFPWESQPVERVGHDQQRQR